MLKKEYRGLSREEILSFKEKGVMYKTPLFGLVVLKSEKPKVGIIISKKISKKAVDRNRIKRLVYQAVGEDWKEFEKKGIMGLFLVRSVILEKSYEEIKETWQSLLKSF